MSADLLEKLEAVLTKTELWALAASKPHHGEGPTVEGGIHWTWAVGDDWEPYEPNPLEEHLGEGAESSTNVQLITVEEFPYSFGSTGNGQVIGYMEEVRTSDAWLIVHNDPARVLRRVARDRKLLELAAILHEDYQDNAAQHLLRLLAEDYEIEVES